MDHVIPKSQGGKDEPDNLVTVCHWCNSVTSRMKIREGLSKKLIIKMKKQRVKERLKEFSSF